MKKILLTLCMVGICGIYLNTNAQCTFANPGVKINGTPYTDPVTGKCIMNVDLYFDILHNAGGKYFWVHIWPTSQYPNHDYTPASDVPTTSVLPGGNGILDNSIATFGMYHKSPALYMLSSYPPDANVPNFQYAGLTISEVEGGGILPGSDRYTLKGLNLSLPLGCDISQSFTADLWESQAAGGQTIACYTKGIVFYANDPKVSGLLFCQIPRQFRFDISTIIQSGSLSIDYKVYIDNGDGIYNKTTDNIDVHTGNVVLDNVNNSYHSPVLGYEPYSYTKPQCDRALWVVISSPSIPNEIYARIENLCIPLAVKFLSFTATRKNDNVELAWSTASEENNKGFFIERKYGNADWTVLGFVQSAAGGGNSDIKLNYSYTDHNAVTGISLYRIRQVNIDNKSAYSDVRTVSGMEQKNRIVIFPNPSQNGQLNILLHNLQDEASISLINMNGGVVKEWKNITTNQLNISNVPSGLYTLRVWINGSNEVQNLKVVVNGK